MANVWDAYRAKVTQIREDLTEKIADGGAKDYAEYQAMVRERKAMKRCLDEFNDILKGYLEDDD